MSRRTCRPHVLAQLFVHGEHVHCPAEDGLQLVIQHNLSLVLRCTHTTWVSKQAKTEEHQCKRGKTPHHRLVAHYGVIGEVNDGLYQLILGMSSWYERCRLHKSAAVCSYLWILQVVFPDVRPKRFYHLPEERSVVS